MQSLNYRVLVVVVVVVDDILFFERMRKYAIQQVDYKRPFVVDMVLVLVA